MIDKKVGNRIIYRLVVLHALASGFHGWAHSYSVVPNSLPQKAFILVVTVLTPLVAAVYIARGHVQLGYALFAFAMIGSMIFGGTYHFVLDTPDLCSSVKGVGAKMYLYSAVTLISVQGLALVATPLVWRKFQSESSQGWGSLYEKQS